MAKEFNINAVIVEAHKAAIQKAIDDSERTGVPLIIYENGKIVSVPPKFKYVRVPIDFPVKKTVSRKKSTARP